MKRRQQEDRKISSALISKLSNTSFKKRVIKRNLLSIASRIEGTLICPRSEKQNESENEEQSLEYPVPQQEWDDLLESAFVAVAKVSMDFFDPD